MDIRRRMITLGVAVAVLLGAVMVACFSGGSSSSEGTSSQQPPAQVGTYPLPDVRGELAAAGERNSDVVGWLYVPGTNINEPIVQSVNNDFYLRRDAYKNYSYAGCYYLDYRSSFNPLSQNSIIYGHNLGTPMGVMDNPNGVKFAQLLKFAKLDFAQEHPYIYITTQDSDYVFRIFAVFYSEAYTNPVEYHHNSYSDEQFALLLDDVRARSQHVYDIPVDIDDKIITLSTCTYKYGTYSQNDDQRFVVMGRLVQGGEEYAEAAPVTQNENIKAPDFS